MVDLKPSPDRAALVERMAEAIGWAVKTQTQSFRQIAEAALAAVEAAGWGPRPGIGFAVARTADMEESAEAVEDYARMLLSGTAFDWHWALAQRLKEAIR